MSETKADVQLFEDGDSVYANLSGIEFIKQEFDELIGYAWNHPFVVNHVSPECGDGTIYTVTCNYGGSEYEVQFLHSEVQSEPIDIITEVKSAGMFELVPEYSKEQFAKEYDLKFFEESDITLEGKFENLGRELGKIVDSKQLAYGNAVERGHEVMKAFLHPYHNEESKTYTIPQELLLHLQLMVRTMDKFNRIVNNPSQDLMQENTYNDIVGYALLGSKLSGR